MPVCTGHVEEGVAGERVDDCGNEGLEKCIVGMGYGF